MKELEEDRKNSKELNDAQRRDMSALVNSIQTMSDGFKNNLDTLSENILQTLKELGGTIATILNQKKLYFI